MKFYILAVALLMLEKGNAQTKEIRVKAGDDIAHSISEYGKYRFADFRQARLYYAHGKTATAKFNYNYLVEEMQFIDVSTGDTLAIADPEQVRYIIFDSAIFYYNEGFMELIKNYDSVKIARKQKLSIRYEKIGAYGQPSPTSAIDNNRTYIDQNQNMVYNLIINQDAVIKKEITWYLITDNSEKPIKADKAGFLKLYPNHSSDIKDFLKVNKGALKDLESINKLVAICLA